MTYDLEQNINTELHTALSHALTFGCPSHPKMVDSSQHAENGLDLFLRCTDQLECLLDSAQIIGCFLTVLILGKNTHEVLLSVKSEHTSMQSVMKVMHVCLCLRGD